jgi:hypothetical protein
MQNHAKPDRHLLAALRHLRLEHSIGCKATVRTGKLPQERWQAGRKKTPAECSTSVDVGQFAANDWLVRSAQIVV